MRSLTLVALVALLGAVTVEAHWKNSYKKYFHRICVDEWFHRMTHGMKPKDTLPTTDLRDPALLAHCSDDDKKAYARMCNREDGWRRKFWKRLGFGRDFECPEGDCASVCSCAPTNAWHTECLRLCEENNAIPGLADCRKKGCELFDETGAVICQGIGGQKSKCDSCQPCQEFTARALATHHRRSRLTCLEQPDIPGDLCNGPQYNDNKCNNKCPGWNVPSPTQCGQTKCHKCPFCEDRISSAFLLQNSLDAQRQLRNPQEILY